MTGTVPDRRQRRRQETIEQVLDVAAAVMADQGVAGLTLGEVARRMGIRPPSLYVYVESKNALYDALFERGYRALLASMLAFEESVGDLDPVARAHAFSAAMVRWSVEHPGYAPLMFWRPVPGFTPSEAAYAPAVELSERGRQFLAGLRSAGALAPGTDLDLAFRTFTTLVSGAISQQLSNAPEEPFESGMFTSTLPALIDMWLAHYARSDDDRDRPPGGRNRVPDGARRRGDEPEESR